MALHFVLNYLKGAHAADFFEDRALKDNKKKK
jgi:hypothetical protein